MICELRGQKYLPPFVYTTCIIADCLPKQFMHYAIIRTIHANKGAGKLRTFVPSIRE